MRTPIMILSSNVVDVDDVDCATARLHYRTNSSAIRTALVSNSEIRHLDRDGYIIVNVITAALDDLFHIFAPSRRTVKNANITTYDTFEGLVDVERGRAYWYQQSTSDVMEAIGNMLTYNQL